MKEPDITDPKEFKYDYLLVVTKFTLPNEVVFDKKLKGTAFYIPEASERLYYRWEDDVFERKAEVSFCFQSTSKEVADDGTKSYIQGPCSQSGGGKETHYRMIYLLKWEEYVKAIPVLE